jgi:cytochrome c oxidase subunit 1
MPRRVADYPDAFSDWNFVSSLGAYVFAAGMLVFLVNMVFAFVRKAPANRTPRQFIPEAAAFVRCSAPPNS